MNPFIKEIEIDYNKKILLEEAKQVDYKPFQLEKPLGCWFDYAPSWLQGRGHDDLLEVNRISNFIEEKIGSKDVRPRFYRQEANTEVPMHQDNGTLCAINIVLSESYGPIQFEKLEDPIYYKCAIVNVAQRHSVPAHQEERILLKYSIFDVDYDTAVKRWVR